MKKSPDQQPSGNDVLSFDGSADETINADAIPSNYIFPMGQQDWDNIMVEFESELGDFDSRAATSIIEPYISQNTEW
jgi:hypothetical protein